MGKILGDMVSVLSVPVRIMPALERYPESFLKAESVDKLIACVNKEHPSWVFERASLAAEVLSDPTLYEETELPGCLGVLLLNDEPRVLLEEQLNAVIEKIGLDSKIEVKKLHGFLFDSGIVSVLVHLKQALGWEVPKEQQALGGEHRGTVAAEVQVFLEKTVAPVAQTVQKQLEKCADYKKPRRMKFEPTAEVPYIDFIYGGLLSKPEETLELDNDYRQLLQPDHRGRLQSQSPDPSEFVWLGSVCSIIVTNSESAQELRLSAITTLIAVYSAFFDQLTAICDAVKEIAESQKPLEFTEIERYEERIQIYFNQLSGPSFTYQKDLRVLRRGIFEQWEVMPLFNQAQFLLSVLNKRAQGEYDRKAARASRFTNILLIVISLLSLISVFADGTEIMERIFG